MENSKERRPDSTTSPSSLTSPTDHIPDTTTPSFNTSTPRDIPPPLRCISPQISLDDEDGGGLNERDTEEYVITTKSCEVAEILMYFNCELEKRLQREFYNPKMSFDPDALTRFLQLSVVDIACEGGNQTTPNVPPAFRRFHKNIKIMIESCQIHKGGCEDGEYDGEYDDGAGEHGEFDHEDIEDEDYYLSPSSSRPLLFTSSFPPLSPPVSPSPPDIPPLAEAADRALGNTAASTATPDTSTGGDGGNDGGDGDDGLGQEERDVLSEYDKKVFGPPEHFHGMP